MSPALLRTRSNHRRRDTRSQARASIRDEVPTVVGQTTGGPLTDHDVAERFSATVLGFTPAQLAQAARCTKEGAKHWVYGTRCPSLPKALEMARSVPAVRKWMLQEMGERVGFDSPEEIDRAIRILLQAKQQRELP